MISPSTVNIHRRPDIYLAVDSVAYFINAALHLTSKTKVPPAPWDQHDTEGRIYFSIFALADPKRTAI